MANYYGSSRSNYFRVKDNGKFEEFMDSMSLELIEDSVGRVGFLVNNESGGIPYEIYNEEIDDYVEVDFDKELTSHLQDDQVAIYQEVGAENLRYLTGYSVAVNSKGEKVVVSINDIYKIAEKQLGGKDITLCEY